jgi:hypothetical protein
MVSKDNLATVGFSVLAAVLTIASVLYTTAPPWANLSMLLLVGLVIPRLIKKYVDPVAVGTPE